MAEEEKEAEVEEIDSVETLNQILAEEKEKTEKYLANWQRAQADFINFKKHAEEEKAEIIKFSNATLVSTILPVLDDFERAFDNVSEKLSGLTWVDGMKFIYHKLESILESQGLSKIEAVGKDFDPNLHEAVLYDEGEEGKVIEEFQKGYKFHDKVIRPTLVKVGRGKKG